MCVHSPQLASSRHSESHAAKNVSEQRLLHVVEFVICVAIQYLNPTFKNLSIVEMQLLN